MNIADWLMITAVLVGPVLAVQAQKFLEALRAARDRRLYIFKILMTTRGNRISIEHVQALNMIDIEFYSSRKYATVRKAWHTYKDHLDQGVGADAGEAAERMWVEKLNDYFCKLLVEMGNALDYDFSDVEIKRGIYSPIAHATMEDEVRGIRQAFLQLLSGQKSLPISIKNESDK